MHQDDLFAIVNRFLAAPPSPACLLLLDANPLRLALAAATLRERFRWPEWPISRELSAALLDTPTADRPAAARDWFNAAIAERRPGPILMTNIELLFEPSLQVDPLRLLRGAAREAQLIVAWPGAIVGDRLTYAVAEHSHYRTWPAADLPPACLITL